ncbi:DNA-dependent metalloprotease-like protein [Cyphellophora attinorum]|uniref:DNA-dependent metalloprotease-like protein n=1 Tax=Cyphellophora attinorum TaxID=1664694 RepID=A0A0N1NYF4_9EURO|nr:DNA-dependent metalloprotease-like protein [Phialophora attinorum]KPI40044.1 DNA-dependent metalloprotease-like protein [Phialophora attinorum]
MPINTIRLNHQKSSHPNDRIIFIKPLPRPPTQQAEHDIADTFLRAIAAQCLPITKKHWLSVTTLEEYEPNREFMGRNFNHGECIQLVLRSKSGAWLPFNMVQMVMMHELAHNVEMNHSKRFWAKRNEFAGEMRELWAKGYTGEGFWGSGRVMGDMHSVMGNNVVASAEIGDLPLCGGTYRSRRRKRKVATNADGKELSWKEKKERRIEKKFGKNGVSLGTDEDTRMGYEIGKGPIGGNPRVAQSKRGRELRAAAALARFEQSKQAVKAEQSDQEDGVHSDDYEDADAGLDDATDRDGRRLTDAKGDSMIRVCGDEESDDIQVKQELEELEGLERYFPRVRQSTPSGLQDGSADREDDDRSNATTETASPSPSPESSSRPSKHASDTAPDDHQTETVDLTVKDTTDNSVRDDPTSAQPTVPPRTSSDTTVPPHHNELATSSSAAAAEIPCQRPPVQPAGTCSTSGKIPDHGAAGQTCARLQGMSMRETREFVVFAEAVDLRNSRFCAYKGYLRNALLSSSMTARLLAR